MKISTIPLLFMILLAGIINYVVAEILVPKDGAQYAGGVNKTADSPGRQGNAGLNEPADAKETPPPAPAAAPEQDKAAREKMDAAEEFYQLGLAALKEKQYEKAAGLFTKATSYYKRYILAYARAGDAFTLLNNEEAAYENYKKCLGLIDDLKSPSGEMTKLRDEIFHKSEKFRAQDERVAAINAEFVSKLMELGRQCLADNDYILADDIFSTVLRIDSANKEASDCRAKAKKEIE